MQPQWGVKSFHMQAWSNGISLRALILFLQSLPKKSLVCL